MSSPTVTQKAPLLIDDPQPEPSRELAAVPSSAEAGSQTTLMFERLARDPNVDVEKLERLIAMQERIMKHNAEAAFNAAFARLLKKIPTIIEKADWDDKGTYAPLEDIIEIVRPILADEGFSLSFRTQWPDANTVKVIGILTHEQGHSRESEFISAADKSGSKNSIQALGSATQYGRRYTTKDLLCIVTRGEDDNGQKTEGPVSPEGYDEWLSELQEVAMNQGMPGFAPKWNASRDEYRKFLAKTAPKMLASIKTKAAQVKAAK